MSFLHTGTTTTTAAIDPATLDRREILKNLLGRKAITIPGITTSQPSQHLPPSNTLVSTPSNSLIN